MISTNADIQIAPVYLIIFTSILSSAYAFSHSLLLSVVAHAVHASTCQTSNGYHITDHLVRNVCFRTKSVNYEEEIE